MKNHQVKWKSLFFFCAGLAAGSAFCMKWMESDLWADNARFTIMGLEIFYPREKVTALMQSMDDTTRRVLDYHLHFDFAFMAGIFPAIASLCMIAAAKLPGMHLKKVLIILAAMQSIAWGLDIIENIHLIRWNSGKPVGNEFVLFHYVVILKWLIALFGVLTAIVVILLNRKS